MGCLFLAQVRKKPVRRELTPAAREGVGRGRQGAKGLASLVSAGSLMLHCVSCLRQEWGSGG
eukprot:14724400-Alexandrium_andersonii.AAC.1